MRPLGANRRHDACWGTTGVGPDRIDDSRGSTPPTTSRRRFEELVPRRKRPSGERASRPRAMPGSGGERMRLAARESSAARDARGTARTAIEAAARGRQHDGTEATLAATSRLQGRARALLNAEADVAARGVGRGRSAAPQAGPWPVAPPEGPPSTPPPHTGPASGSDVGPLAALADAGARAERALLLVEKVELLLRSGRPAFRFTRRSGASRSRCGSSVRPG